MMGVSWGALAGAFLAPFLYGLYWKGITKVSVVVCFVWGCGIALLQLFVTLGGVDVSGWGTVLGYIFKSSINSGVIAMVGGLAIVPVISLFTKKQDGEELDKIFACCARVISAIKPEYVGFLTLMVEPGTEMYDQLARGEIELLEPQEVLDETELFIRNVDAEGTMFRSNHASNYIALGGTLNRERNKILDQIAASRKRSKFRPDIFRGI